jgi:hypothetical protein
MGATRRAPALRLADGARNPAPVDGAKIRSKIVSIKQACGVVLAFLALLTVGFFGASAAYGEAGPFWHQRSIGKKGNGVKIEEKAPESFSGEGAEQILIGDIGSEEVEITARSVQAKGTIYNNALQGQFKLLQKYSEPKVVKPVLPGCAVKLGTNDELRIFGHLAWKWNGQKKQLEEKPQAEQKPSGVGVPDEIVPGETKLPEGTITEVSLTPSKECGVLTGIFPVKGSISAFPKPDNLEEWSTSVVIVFPGWEELHLWNGKESIGVGPGLRFAGNSAGYKGQSEVSTKLQEVAVFEK